MKTPAFWRNRGLASTLLLPLAGLYRLAASGCEKKESVGVGVPVICVGNVTAGGAGKTPVALDLIARLKEMGRTPHALTRGYGGAIKGPAQVDPSWHTAADVGDEALLLARAAPTWVSRQRVPGARAAAAAGANMIVMDDGFQNPALKKDLSLLIVDGGFGFGNERLIPAGPLREPLQAALLRADAVVIMGRDDTGAAKTVRTLAPDMPILGAHTRPRDDHTHLKDARVVAFAGMGRPEKFFDTLRKLGAKIVHAQPYADHHPFSSDDLTFLQTVAKRKDAKLVTTEKDLMRLPTGVHDVIDVIGIEVVWDDVTELNALLTKAMG